MCYLGKREQRAMFLVVSGSNVHFGFEHTFFACAIGRASKIKRNLSTSASHFHMSFNLSPFHQILANTCFSHEFMKSCNSDGGFERNIEIWWLQWDFLENPVTHMHHNFSNKHAKALVWMWSFGCGAHKGAAPISKKVKWVILNSKIYFFEKKDTYKENVIQNTKLLGTPKVFFLFLFFLIFFLFTLF